MCKAYGCEPSTDLFRGFFNLFPVGKWLTFAKRPEKHITNLLPKVITLIEGWKGRFFFVFPDPILFLAGLKTSWEHGQQRPTIIVGGKEIAIRNFLYAEIDEDLTFLPKEPSPDFGIGSPFVSINTEPAITVAEPTGQLDRKCRTRGGYSKPPVKRILVQGSFSSRATRQKTVSLNDDSPFLTISDDGEELLDLYDRCYARQAVVDNAVNQRAWELIKAKCEAAMADFDNNLAVKVLREKIVSLLVEVKEHKDSLNRMILESKKWVGYQVSLLTVESKVSSLKAEKAKLETAEASLRQEVENVRCDRAEVVSKVVPYMKIELVQSDDMCKLVAMLVSSAIFFGRCYAFKEVVNVKEPFDIIKVKGYRSSYKQEHIKAGNEFVTATFPFLYAIIADPHASFKALLSKKPQILQHPALMRTQIPASSAPSQKATPSSAPLSKLLSPPSQITPPATPVSEP
ncbi:hypothetical protein Tco_1010420 [Tanacetum coccineum]